MMYFTLLFKIAIFLVVPVLKIAAKDVSNTNFHISIDDTNGALIGIFDPQSQNSTSMNWISSTENAPWQPLSSRWGLGFYDDGEHSLKRHFWKNPKITCESEVICTATYNTGTIELRVKRTIDEEAFTEQYTFKNLGDSALDLAEQGTQAFAIYTPFNDHYTNTSDAIANRAHSHVWAHGGSTAWVKTDQMGGLGRNLGLVLTRGSLVGYSIEARDSVTLSNTRGVFLLHPKIPLLEPGSEETLEWKLFWHSDWDDFFKKSASLSEQFVNFNLSRHTIYPNETATIGLSGALVNSDATVNGKLVSCSAQYTNSSSKCTFSYSSTNPGEKKLTVTTVKAGSTFNSTVILNVVQPIEDLLLKRANFITQRQQIADDFQQSSLQGAYVLYDNQMNGTVTFDTRSDRNSGRERIGMGIFLARYLRRNPNAQIEESLRRYYQFVCSQLQESTGYVKNGPENRGKRLYNWPWFMQFHVAIANLNRGFESPYSETSKPVEMFSLTLENFYSEEGGGLYAIGLPIFEGLKLLEKEYGSNSTQYSRALSLFREHCDFILERGVNYPRFEVNFEQSIVAPAAVMLLEFYRVTSEKKYLEGAELQLETLLRFSGKQPDHHLHDVSIRHWDGYWFGKDRMWGDTFPHHWSTLNAIALHHYGQILDRSNGTSSSMGLNDPSYQAEGILRSNLALFDTSGAGHCAWIYPTSVNGRAGRYADPYANDQDWVLNHLLQVQDSKE